MDKYIGRKCMLVEGELGTIESIKENKLYFKEKKSQRHMLIEEADIVHIFKED